MSDYPIAIQNFQDSILKLKGITAIESGVCNLGPIDLAMLKLAEFSHLPHASLLRTHGGLENEVLIQFEFYIEPSVEGWQSLEFMAWFVRDCARGGTKIQLRPFALPPETPNGRQFGTTLRFHMDLFVDGIEDNLEPVFKAIRDINKSFNMVMNLYKIPLKL